VLLGSIPISFPNMLMPMKLGLAGGPLIVAILIGRFGYKLKLVTYTTQSANLMLREVGICLFLSSVGIGAGAQFVETVISENGLLWLFCGFLITLLPLVIVGSCARRFFDNAASFGYRRILRKEICQIQLSYVDGRTVRQPDKPSAAHVFQLAVYRRRSRGRLFNRVSTHHVFADTFRAGFDSGVLRVELKRPHTEARRTRGTQREFKI